MNAPNPAGGGDTLCKVRTPDGSGGAMERGAPCLTGRARWDAALVAGGLVFVFAARGAARDVTFEDAGLLVAAAHALGVPHPPGYPLWTLLAAGAGRVGALFGLGAAHALALFSAAGLAAAAACVAALVRSRGAGPALAAAAGLALALAPTPAAQGTAVEVYALALALQALFLALALAPIPRPGWTAFVFGLGLCAHPNTLYLAGLLPYVFLRARDRARPGRLFAWAAAGLAPLALYAYVPLAARRDPAVNWGEAKGGEALLDHLLRAQYRTGLERDVAAQGAFLWEQSAGQWPLLVAAAALLALAFGRRLAGGPGALLALVGATLAGAGLAFWAVNWPMEPAAKARLAGSYSPLPLLLAAGSGLAFAAAARAFATRLGSLAGPLFAALLLAVALVPSPKARFAALDARAEEVAGEYADALLGALPADALLVVNRLGHTDVLGFPLLHRQVVLGLRPDVVLVDRGLLSTAWYRAQLARRAPDLAPALVRFEAHLAERLAADPRAARLAQSVFFDGLWDGPRPLAFTDRPGPAVTRGRELLPGPAHWEWVPPQADLGRRAALRGAETWRPRDAAPSGETNLWIELVRELAEERELARRDWLAEETR